MDFSRRRFVLLLDIGLPGLDGYQVARRFRSDDELKDVFIIAISGYSPDMSRDAPKPADFDHDSTKPVDFKTLLSLIHKVG